MLYVRVNQFMNQHKQIWTGPWSTHVYYILKLQKGRICHSSNLCTLTNKKKVKTILHDLRPVHIKPHYNTSTNQHQGFGGDSLLQSTVNVCYDYSSENDDLSGLYELDALLLYLGV